ANLVLCKVAMRGNMHNTKLALLYGLLQTRRTKRLVEQDLAAVELLNAVEFLRHSGQGRIAFKGAREPDGQHLRLGLGQRPWLSERQAGGDGQGILFNEEPLAIVKGRQRQQAERAIRHQDDGLDG